MFKTFSEYLNEVSSPVPEYIKHIPYITKFSNNTNTHMLSALLRSLFTSGGKLKQVSATHDPKNKPKEGVKSFILTNTKTNWMKLEAYEAHDPKNIKKIVKILNLQGVVSIYVLSE